MKVALFCHSILSDWNHGNAHFLRGVVTELRRRGARVRVYEPANGWSAQNLVAEEGALPIATLEHQYPLLGAREVVRYAAGGPYDLDAMLDDMDLVIVHEWTDPELVARIGRARAGGASCVLLFHDTHHRSVTAPEEMERYALDGYDGVLAFGEAVREVYLRQGWARRVFVWHEAADVHVFWPQPRPERRHDLVWIGNWGDEERTTELREFLFGPARALRPTGSVYGVRYPAHALQEVHTAGLVYRGRVANPDVPTVYARHRVTVHVPRRPYVRALPGIPTIRPFEALACGIPLVCSPWDDAEGLFEPGRDYLVARDGGEMAQHLRALLNDEAYAAEVAAHGLETVRSRHTCAHRVDELMRIAARIRTPAAREVVA